MLKIAWNETVDVEFYDSLRLVFRAARDAADVLRRPEVLLCVRKVEVVDDPLRDWSGQLREFA